MMVNKMKCTENQVKNAISDYLAIMRIHCWRQNSGGYGGEYKKKDGTKKKRFFWFMQWLWPRKDEGLIFLDIGGILPDGRYFEVEVKATGKEPTEAQYYTIAYIKTSTNAVALWADSVDMFIEKWRNIKQ
ncbi:unnamed protein product [marine sediment metagenome]|uniref:VRR-NUC domain-containing protein n=1 Tax=marine sediment metagenome TaxID=412755 RepID=X0YH13_9ZZZZ